MSRMSSHLSHTDSHLYNVPRPKKNKDITTSSTSSLNFTSTLSSLISSAPSTSESRGRPRPSQNKSDIFTSHNKGAKKRASQDIADQDDASSSAGRKKGDRLGDVDDKVLARSRRKLEEKARKYKELKGSSYIPEDDNSHGLIEWDRKWAEKKDDSDSESEIDEINPGSKQIVEFEDEFGRVRTGTVAEKERMERKMRNQLLGAEELERMSARPKMPEGLIFGPTVQTEAFMPDEETEQKMEDLARKRDRSATPPPASHYDASKEIRSKGVGFYAFSKDEELREQEMRDLESERKETERLRKERDEKKNARKREIEARREEVAKKRAKKMADKFLDEMSNEAVAAKEA